jgi:hypothetical protein
VEGFWCGRGRNARALLAAVTYAYARHRLASQEIEESGSTDAHLAYLNARQTLRAGEVRLFRRQNRELLTSAVAEVLQLAGNERWRRWLATVGSVALPFPVQGCGRVVARPDPRAEATARILRAIHLDSMAADA